MAEFVYVLIHDAMPGLVKIGRTSATVADRIRQLSNTSVPYEFQCYYAAEVEDSANVERRLHQAFGEQGVGKEFFRIDPRRVMAVLEMVAIRDATPREEIVVPGGDGDAVIAPDREKLGRGKFSMFAIGLKKGDVLEFSRDSNITAVVESDTSVIYEGDSLSLSRSAIRAIQRCGYSWTHASGPLFWTFQGLSLREHEERLREDS